MNPLAKDTKLRWEITALAKQISCLVADPDQIAHNDGDIVPLFGRQIEELAVRAQHDSRYHFPTQQEYSCLLDETQLQLSELIMVQLNKHRIWCGEQAAKNHWDDGMRNLLKSQGAYLLEIITKLAEGRYEEVVTEVLPKRPPIIDIQTV